MKDWILREIRLSSDAKQYGMNVLYPYFVIGTFAEGNGTASGSAFSWHLPSSSLDNPRYDFSQVTLDERPKPNNKSKEKL